MSADISAVRLSPLDSKRWKALTAKASDVTHETFPAVMAFCRQHDVAFLIARCPATDLAAAQAMEREGFQLMDTLVYFSRDLERAAPQDPGQAAIRELRAGEDTAVRQVASLSFSGYLGHYHADPRLDRSQCDETYMDWAQRSCLSKEAAEAVLVGTIEGRIVAFATLRLNSAEEGEGVLFGVAPEARGRGMYRSLMIGALLWFRARGTARMVVSTQVTNAAVQKVWTRLGFEPWKSHYTFHKWF